jgi:hypothetical protein
MLESNLSPMPGASASTRNDKPIEIRHLEERINISDVKIVREMARNVQPMPVGWNK